MGEGGHTTPHSYHLKVGPFPYFEFQRVSQSVFTELEMRTLGEGLTRGSPFQFGERGPRHYSEFKIGKRGWRFGIGMKSEGCK